MPFFKCYQLEITMPSTVQIYSLILSSQKDYYLYFQNKGLGMLTILPRTIKPVKIQTITESPLICGGFNQEKLKSN